MWYIVEFDEGNEIVPREWLSNDKVTCSWPPYRELIKIARAVEDREVPGSEWRAFPVVRVMASAGKRLS